MEQQWEAGMMCVASAVDVSDVQEGVARPEFFSLRRASAQPGDVACEIAIRTVADNVSVH